MHRPPKPVFKSSQMFPTQIRKIFTPDFFYHESQEDQNQPIVRSMLENIQQKHDDKGTNKTYEKEPKKIDNAECLEISKKNSHNLSQKNTNGGFYGRSFKIRNYTNHRVKENTIPMPIQINSSRKINVAQTQHKQSNPIQRNYIAQNAMQSKIVMLSGYPHSLDLTHLNAKINMIKIPERNANMINKRQSSNQIKMQEDILLSDRPSSELNSKCMSDFSEWCIVISQNTVQGDLTNQSLIAKINNICLNFKSKHNGITIVFKLDKQRDAEKVSKVWGKHQMKIDYMIWGKQKHVERVVAFNLFEITKYKNIRRIVVFEDILQFSRSYFYISNENEPKSKSVDSSKKIAYLKINGLQCFHKLSKAFTINQFDDQIYLGECAFKDETHNYMMEEQVYNKVNMAMNRRLLKKKRTFSRRSNSIKQLSHELLAPASSKSLCDKNQQFKRKMIQYVKILQQDHRTHCKKNIERPKTQSHNNIDFFDKGKALKLIEVPRYQNSSRTPYQIVYQLIKNNSVIFKQIMKYQMEIEGLELPVHSNKMVCN